MSVRVQLDKEHDVCELGDDIDGVWIAFTTIPGPSVRGRVSDVNAASTDTSATSGGGGGKVTGNIGDDFDPSDFTDNGDGSFTRKSDGTQGRFTPTGFEPITAP